MARSALNQGFLFGVLREARRHLVLRSARSQEAVGRLTRESGEVLGQPPRSLSENRVGTFRAGQGFLFGVLREARRHLVLRSARSQEAVGRLTRESGEVLGQPPKSLSENRVGTFRAGQGFLFGVLREARRHLVLRSARSQEAVGRLTRESGEVLGQPPRSLSENPVGTFRAGQGFLFGVLREARRHLVLRSARSQEAVGRLTRESGEVLGQPPRSLVLRSARSQEAVGRLTRESREVLGQPPRSLSENPAGTAVSMAPGPLMAFRPGSARRAGHACRRVPRRTLSSAA